MLPTLQALENRGTFAADNHNAALDELDEQADRDYRASLPPPAIDPVAAHLAEMIAGRDEIDRHFVAMRAGKAPPGEDSPPRRTAAEKRRERTARRQEAEAARELGDLRDFLAKCQADPEGFEG